MSKFSSKFLDIGAYNRGVAVAKLGRPRNKSFIFSLVPAMLAVGFWSCGAPLVDLPKVDASVFSGPVKAAIEKALKDASAAPNNPAAVARLGMVLQAHQQNAAAAQAYQRAVSLDPHNRILLYYWGTALAADGRNQEAIEPLRRAVAPHNAAFRMKLADTLYAAGKVDEAAAEYQSLIHSNPDLAAAYYGLGRTQEGQQAARNLEKAIELFPRYGAARFSLAAVYRQMDRRKEAEALLVDYERDKLLVPPLEDPAMSDVLLLDESSTGLLRQAQAKERAGYLIEAAAIHERVAAADPKMPQAWINLISLYGRTGEPARAEAAYRKAIALAPGNGEAHYNYGVFCVQNERWSEAKNAFQAAIAADPTHAEALDNLGALIERSGQVEQAAELFRRAVAAKPTLRLAQYHLGRYYASRRRYPEAIAALEAALTPVDRETATYVYALGAVHARNGAKDQALHRLEEARRLAMEWQRNDLVQSIDRDLQALRR